MRIVRSLARSLPGLGMLLACSNAAETPDRCFVNLAPITARTNVVGVGDTVAFHATLGPAACLPAGITTEDWRWSSSDTLTARIDSLSGLAQGAKPGDVVIQVQHAQDPQFGKRGRTRGGKRERPASSRARLRAVGPAIAQLAA